ncbi:MAG TPA: glutathione S-transferase N-terminal domain-containing protein [Caulobacteraceae bacterium]|jgi:glutathione S-transferase/GST-like protein
MSAPIEVWFWPTPNGRKITLACEEMGLDYVIRPVDIGRGEQFTPEFLAISPNNRMPAITDPDGPDGKPISVFESGAILQYLGRKTGKFYPADERARVEVDEWLFWQMAGLGPMAGQANHFRIYAPSMLPDARMTAYGAGRYTNEVNRLFGVLDKRLKGRDFVCGDYSIADMAIWPWTRGWKAFGQDLNDFPNMKAWSERIEARPAVKIASEKGEEMRRSLADHTEDAEAARKLLFGQRARA